MKNVLLVGLVAGLLFAVSAGLSLWLNQTKPQEDSTTSKPANRKSATTESAKDVGVPKPVTQPAPKGDSAELPQLADQLKADLLRVSQRKDELDHKHDLHRFILEDVRSEMDLLQKQLKLLGTETKRLTANPNGTGGPLTLPPTPVPGPAPGKGAAEPPGKNAGMAKGLPEAMTPESAAKLVEQMARTGKLDSAVQFLSKMSPRQVAKILGLIADEKLSFQIFEKLLELKQPAAPSGSP